MGNKLIGRMKAATDSLKPAATREAGETKDGHVPRTGPGLFMAFMEKQSHISQENKLLKEQLDVLSRAPCVQPLDPKLISASPFSNRTPERFRGAEYERLKSSIRDAGTIVSPVKVRPGPDVDPQRYELVYGYRRHRICLELGIKVLAIVESMDDEMLVDQMDRENIPFETI